MLSYNVVFKTIADCTHKGVITRTTFKDKKTFDKWYKGKMQDGSGERIKDTYEVVEEGIPDKRAKELCSSPEATKMAINVYQNKFAKVLDSFFEAI
jgi:hypothetical protein